LADGYSLFETSEPWRVQRELGWKRNSLQRMLLCKELSKPKLNLLKIMRKPLQAFLPSKPRC
jgi:hypothetical protein